MVHRYTFELAENLILLFSVQTIRPSHICERNLSKLADMLVLQKSCNFSICTFILDILYPCEMFGQTFTVFWYMMFPCISYIVTENDSCVF